MWDTTLRKPKYGSRKALIEHLLSEWLQKEIHADAGAGAAAEARPEG